MNKSKKIVFMTMVLSLGQMTFAQSYDQKYSNWKEKQQAQDVKLSSQPQVKSSESVKPKSKTEVSSAKININTANVDQLQQLSGVGLKKAQAIIEYRNKNGKFKSVEEIQQVKGIGPALFEKNKAKLVL